MYHLCCLLLSITMFYLFPSRCFTLHSPLSFLPSFIWRTPIHLCVEIHPAPLHAFLSFHPSCFYVPLCNLILPSILPPSFNPPPSLLVLWWGAGWPWIPLLLWGNNRHSLLLCVPLSPTWGPQSTGKEGARERENTSGVMEGKDNERERYWSNNWGFINNIGLACQVFEYQPNLYYIFPKIFGIKSTFSLLAFHMPLSSLITPYLLCFIHISPFL